MYISRLAIELLSLALNAMGSAKELYQLAAVRKSADLTRLRRLAQWVLRATYLSTRTEQSLLNFFGVMVRKTFHHLCYIFLYFASGLLSPFRFFGCC